MKKVVIIGGGFAGAYCTRQLQHDFEVTLIDTKDYFEFTPSVLRTLVEPEHGKKIEVKHSQYLKKGQFVKGEVVSISTPEVKTKSAAYPFDYLIICSGSRYNSPIKEENLLIASRGSELREYAHKLKEAQKVLIIGGGVVGTELAAEIICAFPEKKITIVQAVGELLERNVPKVRKYAQKFLEKRGVKILFNEKMVISSNKKYTTDKGTKLRADLVFLCTGITPNGKFVPKSEIDHRKFVLVNEFLQVNKNTFAAGDIAAIGEEKLAQNAERQAQIVVRNIAHLEKGEELEKYESKPRIMVISLGEWNGIIVYKKFVWTGIVAGILKQLIEWKTMRCYR